MISCKKATALISKSLDEPLSLRERGALGIHLLACSLCRRFRLHAELLRTAVARIDEVESNDEREQIRQAKERLVARLSQL